MSDFDHLIPKGVRGRLSTDDRREIDEDRSAGKEHRFVAEVLRALRVPRKVIDEAADRLGGVANFAWLWQEQLLMYHLAYAEIRGLDIIQLYSTPTKTPVWEAFQQRLAEITNNTGETEIIMPFTCRNLNQRAFAMHNIERMVQESKVYLTFVVRRRRHFVQPWKEITSVIQQLWGDEWQEQGLETKAF